jgi:flagellar biosynthesis/type III secretory pathway protein FliH
MKEKIEKILTVVWEDNNSWESEGSKETIKKALDELSTLIQEERKEAYKKGVVDGFEEAGEYYHEEGDPDNIVWCHCARIDLNEMAESFYQEQYLQSLESEK